MSQRPNILFILADQHNAKVLGHKGHPNVKTPNLDRMAAEGVRFDNAISQNPICTPSRVCFHSGQYCHNHGYYGLNGPNPNGLPNIFGHFRGAGYGTSAIGKIHCPEYWIEDQCDCFHETCECSIGGRSSEYTAFLQERGKEQLEDHGRLSEFGKRGHQSVEGRPSPLTFEESQEGWIVSRTIQFMKQNADAGRPFLAHVSFPRPHQCTSPSEPFWSMYSEDELVLPPNADYEMVHKAPHLRRAAERWRTRNWTLFEPHTFDAGRLRKLHGYLGAVSQVDHAVGQLFDFLRENGLADNTIVIYSADHGDYACEHGIMEKAPGICSDAITRIPCIWWAPAHFPAGHVVSEIVESVDLAPTLCALAGCDPLLTADGKNITHLLRGEQGDVHRFGITEFPWSRSIRRGKYRFVYYPREMFADDYPDGFAELYDLEDDPWEMRNLYFEPGYEALAADLRQELLDWLITNTRPRTAQQASSKQPEPYDQSCKRYNCYLNADGKIHPDRLREITRGNYR